MKNSQDRFGVPEANLLAAQKWKDKKKNKRLAFYVDVPSRREVATLPVEELKATLIGWMCHSPIEIIPSRIQIEEVRTVLLHRDDVESLSELVKMCSNYIAYS